MLPNKQDHTTVNIRTARDRRLDFNSGRAAATCQRTLSDLLVSLPLRLQTSLEIDRLLGFFLEEVKHLLPLTGLSYHHAGAGFALGLGLGQGGNNAEVSYSLTQQGDCIGELNLFSNVSLSEQVLDQLEHLISCLLFPLRNALLYRQAIQASLKDPLTGAGNRIALEQALLRETELSRRHEQALSIVMLDMDHFKTLNDTYGHQAGDAALKAVALLLREQLRNVDMVFRFGGEEFVLVLSNTGFDAAAVVAERIRAAVQTLSLLVGDKQVRLSASLGCATFRQTESHEELLKRADDALYQAKRDGRNLTRMASA
jgi:diguanylate cyclase (GGDEF)-like protein